MAKPKTIHTVESMLASAQEEGDCRLWMGSMGTTKTPQVWHEGKMVAVRRLLRTLAGEETPPGVYVCASCRDQRCIEPQHTILRYPGSHYKAMAKAAHTGTHKTIRRTRLSEWRRANPIKLDADRANAIRGDDRCYREIAATFGISKDMVGKIKRGQLWRDHSNPFAGLGA
jgi:hypothetical protein